MMGWIEKVEWIGLTFVMFKFMETLKDPPSSPMMSIWAYFKISWHTTKRIEMAGFYNLDHKEVIRVKVKVSFTIILSTFIELFFESLES